jgi:hypothetical protein
MKDDRVSIHIVQNFDSGCSENVRSIFVTLITDILLLINKQVNVVVIKRSSDGFIGIFLVSGCGGSHCLKSCVERSQPGVQTLQPSDAWPAIATICTKA